MHIAIVNLATRVTDDEAATMTAAIMHQIRRDAWPVFNLKLPAVTFAPGATAPAGSRAITIVDTIPDEPTGVLGFHTEDQGGKLWGVVACGPVLDAGMKVLTGDWSVASVLSHEVLELWADPSCALWADNLHGRAYSYEVCDPVEAPTYAVDGVSVSNFVTPAWFDPQASGFAAFDHLRELHEPFTIAPGGYCVYENASGPQQQFGDQFPEWRKAMKQTAMARTARRISQAQVQEGAGA